MRPYGFDGSVKAGVIAWLALGLAATGWAQGGGALAWGATSTASSGMAPHSPTSHGKR